MKTPLLSFVLFVSCLASASGSAEKTFPLDHGFAGVKSRYTEPLRHLVQHWPPSDIPYSKLPRDQVSLACIETPGHELYVGLEQVMFVKAPVPRVDEVLSEFENYQKIFPGYDDIHVVRRDGNLLETFWEQHIPLFFVKNIKYELYYLIDHSLQGKAVYRYQLKSSSTLTAMDGVILIEPDGAGGTIYTEYDFFDADYGLLKTFGPGRIWEDGVKGLYLSDLGVKVRSENPQMDFKTIVETENEMAKGFPLKDVLQKRKKFFLKTED